MVKVENLLLIQTRCGKMNIGITRFIACMVELLKKPGSPLCSLHCKCFHWRQNGPFLLFVAGKGRVLKASPPGRIWTRVKVEGQACCSFQLAYHLKIPAFVEHPDEGLGQACPDLLLQPHSLIIAEAPFVLAVQSALGNLGSDFQTASFKESRCEAHH